MRRVSQTRREPTIALINVVFLMLVFFLVAGTLGPPMDRELRLVRTAELDRTPPPDALVVHPDGRLSYRGAEVASVADFLDQGGDVARDTVRLVPDRALPATTLVGLARDLAERGAARVVIVTEEGLR